MAGSGDGPVDVSVVIPTHNRRATLSRTMDTALAQKDVDIEIVVVDDGSSDDTSAFLAGHPDPRVRSVRHEVGRGPAAARNAGVTAATGEWVAFLDDDDLWAPTKLRAQLDVARRTGANVVYVAGLRVDGDLRPGPALPARESSTILEDLVSSNVIPMVSGVIATSDRLAAVGPFDERLSLLADWDMWIRLIDGGRPAACHEPLVAYMAHGQAMSVTSTTLGRRESRIVAERHGELGRRFDRRVGGEDHWLWMAWGNRAAGRRVATAGVYARMAARFRRPVHLLRAAAALIGPPVFAMGPEWAARLERAAAAPSPAWLDELRRAWASSPASRTGETGQPI